MAIESAAYLIGLGLLVYFELRSVLLKKGRPISYHVKKWRDASAWRRWGIAIGIVWLFWHFVLEGY